MDDQELISALADGHLRDEDLARGVRAAAADARGREAWYAYHLVGEVLRTGAAAPGSPPEAFLARLQRRLKEEGAVPVAPAPAPLRSALEPAANDWRWKLAAGFASVAAVASVGWNVFGGSGAPAAQPQLAATSTPPAVQAVTLDPATAPMMRDARLDQLLQAHRQFGGAPALQTTSGFLRNATFEAPGR